MDNKIKRIIKKPTLLFISLGHREFFNWMNDETYLKIAYRIMMGKKLNLNSPVTFNEKLQWLKLYNRQTQYTSLVDKYEVKKWVAEKIGDEYIIPTIGIWDNFDDIDFDILPNQFVIKCTHDSGGILICKNKSRFNKKDAQKKIEKCLKHNFFWGQREWPYKNVKPRIIVEPYMEDSKTKDLRDYKFFTFDGVVRALYIATEREKKEETKFDFFDTEFRHLPFVNGHPNADVLPQKPYCFDMMVELAEKLSEGIPQVRIDFYEVDKKIYFGEMTFSHMSGMAPFEPEEWDRIFGDWIKLPELR